MSRLNRGSHQPRRRSTPRDAVLVDRNVCEWREWAVAMGPLSIIFPISLSLSIYLSIYLSIVLPSFLASLPPSLLISLLSSLPQTRREEWIGGRNSDPPSEFLLAQEMEARGFSRIHASDEALVIREHSRKFQLVVSRVTVWVKRQPHTREEDERRKEVA